MTFFLSLLGHSNGSACERKSKTPVLSGVGNLYLVRPKNIYRYFKEDKNDEKEEIQHIREDIPIAIKIIGNKQLLLRRWSHIPNASIGQKYWLMPIRMRLKWIVSGGRNFIKRMGNIEIVTMLFPCNTGEKTRIWKTAAESQSESSVSGDDRAEIERAGVEGSPHKNERFLSALFVSSKEEIPETSKLIESTLGIGNGMELLQEMEKRRWNRSGLSSRIKMHGSFRAAERNKKMKTNRKQQKKEGVPEYDADLLERISPLGGIDHMET